MREALSPFLRMHCLYYFVFTGLELTCLYLAHVQGVENQDVISFDSMASEIGSADALARRCETLGLNKTVTVEEVELRTLMQIAYSDESQAVVCDLPYTGAQLWLEALARGAPDEYTHLYFRKVTLESKKGNKAKLLHMGIRLSQYFSLLVVRHPFERLVAIYRQHDGLASNPNPSGQDHMEALRSYIFLVDRHEARINGELYDGKLSFRQFVKFVIHSPSRLYCWRGLHDACQPCTIGYDFVAYFHWGKEKKAVLSKRLGITNHTILDQIYDEHELAEWWSYYDDIDAGDITKLYEMYRYDFELFGYKWPLS